MDTGMGCGARFVCSEPVIFCLLVAADLRASVGGVIALFNMAFAYTLHFVARPEDYDDVAHRRRAPWKKGEKRAHDTVWQQKSDSPYS